MLKPYASRRLFDWKPAKTRHDVMRYMLKAVGIVTPIYRRKAKPAGRSAWLLAQARCGRIARMRGATWL